jgi:heme-degrading monooxygenase HmoA
VYSRITLLEIDTMRADIATLRERFEHEVAPRLRELEGYVGVVAQTTPEGKAVLVSLWETQETLDAAAGFAADALADFATAFRSPPGRESYEVVFADLPHVAAGV